MQDYHQLDIWNRAMDYAVRVYELAATLPQEEKYDLQPDTEDRSGQLAVSVLTQYSLLITQNARAGARRIPQLPGISKAPALA
jgi:23S rRNA-intervening sequence protein